MPREAGSPVVQSGLRQRRTFAKIPEIQDVPNLIAVQRDSFKWFLAEGLRETFRDISPIEDYNGNLAVEFGEHEFGDPKYSVEECKEKDMSFQAPLFVEVRFINKETGEIKEQQVFMGDFPLMTDRGTFIINGTERVVVSQLVRSPGVYYGEERDRTTDKPIYTSKVIPARGAWLEFETDKRDIVSVRIDRKRKQPVTVLLKALGIAEDRDEILELFNGSEAIRRSLEKDLTENREEALVEIYKRLRPGEPPTVESARLLLDSLFFNPQRYDLARVGRYKLDKKTQVEVWRSIVGQTLSASAKDPATNKVLMKKGERIKSIDQVESLARAGVRYVDLEIDPALRRNMRRGGVEPAGEGETAASRIYISYTQRRLVGSVLAADAEDSSGSVIRRAGERIDSLEEVEALSAAGIESVTVINEELFYRPQITKQVRNRDDRTVSAASTGDQLTLDVVFALLAEDVEKVETALGRLDLAVREPVGRPQTLVSEDVLSAVRYLVDLWEDSPFHRVDEIDHFSNRRVRSVGELIQNQFRIGLTRMERVVRERMTTQDVDQITPQSLINIRPIVAAIKEFFGSSQLSQFMDQTNPIAGLTHKRRLSALGPGGLSRERAGFEVRDVHPSHYGRMCPIETPEGPNIGLIGSLATFARINPYGFIETPYRRVVNGKVTDTIEYLVADEEEKYVVAQANEAFDAKTGKFASNRVLCRVYDAEHNEVVPQEVDHLSVDYMDVSPRQMVSVATALIPFLEHDDANRALMGSNMQRQAVPLLRPAAPLVGTGMEHRAVVDTGEIIRAKRPGTVEYVDSRRVDVRAEDGSLDTYSMPKYMRSNQGTCINHRPIVIEGETVAEDQVLADGPSTESGELALGQNLLVAFMPWEGYNYEDAIILSERVVKEDLLTSIHIEEYEVEARDTKLGPEEITREIPNVGEDVLANLDEEGVIRVGAEVFPGDVLVGKVTPKGETELTAEERLLRAIFGEKAREVRDTSLKVPHGETGRVIAVRVFSRESGDDLSPGVNELVRVYVAQKRKISEGDKLAGRHGNKGVISKILPLEDMPFLADGTPVDIILNPLGVPSRMNIGQLLETHLGWAAHVGWSDDTKSKTPVEGPIHVATPVFDGAREHEISKVLQAADRNTHLKHKARYGNKTLEPLVPVVGDSGKAVLYDGRTGEPFREPITVGQIYMLKLLHLVDDKIHARSTGPYSLITQQPLGGKAQFGGQRFGEMEVWALYAYGAAYVLQEILTIKSDDVIGRVKAYESIVKGENIPEPGIPESFKVLVKEMQSLCLDVEILGETGEEIELKEEEEDIFKTAEELGLDLTGIGEEDRNPDLIIAGAADDVASEEHVGDFDLSLSMGSEEETE